MSGLRGDVRTLRNIGKNLPTTAIAQRVAARVAPEITTLALASYDAGQTPYGDAWPPGHDGRDVDQVESGAQRAALQYVAIGTRVRCTLPQKYTKYQVGRFGILPRAGQTMPSSWRAVCERISHEECARAAEKAVA